MQYQPSRGDTFDPLAQHEGEAAEVNQIAATVDFAPLTGSNSVAYTHVLTDGITDDPRHFTTMDMGEELWAHRRLPSSARPARPTAATSAAGARWKPTA
ncbi:hypothetical protein ACFUKV_17435 [Streptomyces paradoxus]|uniref:hypothetical protein n=1 Tax=Streptomyces paradoxus TaxID=66375 RepID=UPI00362F9EB3